MKDFKTYEEFKEAIQTVTNSYPEEWGEEEYYEEVLRRFQKAIEEKK